MGLKYYLKELHGKPDCLNRAADILDEMMENIKRMDVKLYNSTMETIEGMVYSITRPQAEQIVAGMKPHGQMWTFEQTEALVKSKGMQGQWVDWYLVMNMCYNDFYSTAKTFGLQNEADFYFNLARDFIFDPDAEPHKVAKYFMK